MFTRIYRCYSPSVCKWLRKNKDKFTVLLAAKILILDLRWRKRKYYVCS
ncbi:hypothetical protein PPRY_a1479 [Pseudoalteromonas prydzensis ACAM 620]|nr:hypothetical protein [Pseudoalteromonas prydzensis ACAM 620]